MHIALAQGQVQNQQVRLLLNSMELINHWTQNENLNIKVGVLDQLSVNIRSLFG